MGRNYYCDYCDKRVRNDIQIRHKHIQGLQHQTAQSEHYEQFKDPKTILNAELLKKTCSKFQQNCCKFGASCRFSHYTPQQLFALQEQVNQQDYKAWLNNQPKQFDESKVTNFLAEGSKPNALLKLRATTALMTKNSHLTPSLRPFDPFADFDSSTEWGW